MELGAEHWFAVQVRPNREKHVAQSLTVKGYNCLLPTSRIRRLTGSGMREIHSPVFPGYLFCRLHVSDSRLPFLTTPDLIGLVGFRNRPTPIERSEMRAIQQITASNETVQPWHYIREGSRVRLVNGPLSGLCGIVVEQRRAAHIVVSVELLQRSIAVEMRSDWAYVVQGVPQALTA